MTKYFLQGGRQLMAKQYGVKEVADVVLYDIATGKPVMFFDTLKMSNIENKATTVDARGGKGNPKLVSWDTNREASVKIQDALMSEKMIGLLVGDAPVEGAVDVDERETAIIVEDTVTTGDSKVTLKYAPKVGTTVYVYNEDETEEMTGVSFNDKEVTFIDNPKAPVGSKAVIYYIRTTDENSTTITVNAEKFPEYFRLVGFTVIRNRKNGKDEKFRFIIDKAKVDPNFTMTFQAEGDPAPFDFNVEVYPLENGDMYRMVRTVD